MIRLVDARAYGITFEDEEKAVEPSVDVFDDPYGLVGTVDGKVVGASAAYALEVSVPGGTPIPASGVTSVAILPTHRRQGVMRALLTEQLQQMRADAMPVATLTASEATIYGRFGFGRIARSAKRTIHTARVEFRPEFKPVGCVRFVDVEEARVVFPGVHDRYRVGVPAMMKMPPRVWSRIFADYPDDRGGASDRVHVVHEIDGVVDACATYRVADRSTELGADHFVKVALAFGVDWHAELELWRFLTSLDLVRTVDAHRPVDDFLDWSLIDMRALDSRSITDHNWGRILDPIKVFEARGYPVDAIVTVGLIDDVFDDLTGSYRIVVDGGRATCERVDVEPDATANIADWASIFFGEVDPRALLAAGRLTGEAGLVKQFFATDRAPFNDVYY